MAEKLLEIKNLTVEFQTEDESVKAVKSLNLSIPKGKTVGLVGESGSGKSVTSLAIMGLIPNPPGRISEGEILYHGEDLTKVSNERLRQLRGNKIAMIFQEPMTSLNPVFTTGNQIDEVLMLHQGMNKEEARKRTIELYEEVGIPEPKESVNKYPHQMSGGQKQRVMIAMAMACEPELLICDEPTTALDVTIQKQVLELMFDLQRKHGMSMLFITHDLAVIADIADEVAVMFRGDLVEQNTTKALFENPQHPYTKGLLACRPSLDENPVRLLTVDDFLNAKEDIDVSSLEMKKPRAISETENPVLLEIKNFNKHFPIKGGIFGRTVDWFKAVDDVSLQVRKGRTLGLVGESGCGKTTLGRSILRLLEPTAGEVIYDGINVTNLNKKEMREIRERMQIIFQDPYSSLNPRMTIGDIITEPMVIHGIGSTKRERYDVAADLLEKVGLKGDHLNRYPHEFSGGQRQRICIARALSLKPEFIICDESVSALDVSVQAQVLNLLQDLQDELGLTYIFISHDLSVVKYISDEIGVMNKGQIVEYGPAEEVYHNPKDEYTKKLLSAIPRGVPKELLQE
ncbi:MULTISPECIES: ABC transporter ATP-binding protein [Halobacteriovorax]|uniref:ABC transporter ATP-binding protein n=1 Tax=Halobacteriovorax vibrionivorans TaxID=2152716 RepID=A0ABY0IGF5_9BACT|nr:MULTISPECIES: ABC transporter ATP-binding protein [Halobacteriovorax]AYF43397.1 ABC transporter, ATP-binding protein [Halobacteriovorax sp. BALOs_7]RZF22030.1 ABC transporter ATP-binding protein [Halobacteriovorax vibrionivorans]TGD47106.1 ABC transporter ATP-binding protein [Halobacteriovorax sp. Y22]